MNENNTELKFYKLPSEPFEIHGLYRPESGEYRRIPEDVAAATSAGVHGLAKNTSGGRIRFKTDSSRLAVTLTGKYSVYSNLTPVVCHACDAYIEGENGIQSYACTLRISDHTQSTYTSLIQTLPQGLKTVTVNLPLYGNVDELSIGLDENAVLLPPRKYAHSDRIVFYGSSITQGGCASRPGLSYQNYISRALDTDYLNLGFSGNAKGEDAIVNYMASLDMCAFVCDYDHNAPDSEHLNNTHFNIYEKVREKHPDIPFIMISRPNFYFMKEDTLRRVIIMKSYLKAYERGDKNVYFIDGSALFNGADRDSCTVDKTHPSDLGFQRMGSVIGDVLKAALKY